MDTGTALYSPVTGLIVGLLVFAIARIWPRRSSRTRMLHVPFTLIRRKELNKDILSKLHREYFVPKHVLSVLERKRFETPADILRDPDLRNSMSPVEFMKLVVPPRYGAPKIEPERVLSITAIRPADSALAVELWTLADKTRRMAISSVESELVSIVVRADGELDPATIRLGGFWWWEWMKLHLTTRRLVHERLTNDRVKSELHKLGQMNPEDQPELDGVTPPVRKVAQLGLLFSSVTGSTTVVGGNVSPDISYNPDGMDPSEYAGDCSKSPDWPFIACCTAHDFCYRRSEDAHGCDECARTECDLDFLKCMLAVAGANPALQQMAFIYFLAVRGFGDVDPDSTFKYCAGSSDAGGYMSLNKALVIAIGLTTIYSLMNGDVLTAAAILALSTGVMAVLGKVLCKFCGQIEEWVEECEADRIEREKECVVLKRNCKKHSWWSYKKYTCFLKYYTCCYFVEYLIRGACALNKVVHTVAC